MVTREDSLNTFLDKSIPMVNYLFITMSLFISVFAFSRDNNKVFYKNQISYLYLYQQNLDLLFSIHKNNIWDKNKIINKLNTSKSLVTGILKDLYQIKTNNLNKNIHNSIIKIVKNSIKLTNTFIDGLSKNNNNWQINFIKKKKANTLDIYDLLEMEE